MEIVLLRHGKAEIELEGFLSAKEFKVLVKKYTKTGIKDNPPEKLKELFNSYYVVSSELTRSLKSAKKIGFNEIHFSSDLLNETAIPHYDDGFIKLPVVVWLIYYRLIWLFGFSKNGESFSQAKSRAKQAVEKLIILAEEKEKLIIIGHGLMNRLIAKQLISMGWVGPVSPGKKYWEYGAYKK